MTRRILFGILICCYLALVIPFSAALKDRPVVVKLGFLPEPEPLKVLVGDQRYLLAQYAVVKVLFYYGTLVEKFQQKITLEPEYYNMFKMLQTSSVLDPYNADVYYFTQAAFTWELKKVAEVNAMLKYGMHFRTWDYQLPFFLGFNCAYFQKDYASAAVYFKEAAKLKGDPLLANLSSRYFYESGQNQLGLSFLEYMERHTTDAKVIALYELRKKALLGVMTLQKAVDAYREKFGRPPERIAELVTSGMLAGIPRDPYGGQFYLDEKGMVRSTSKFAFGPPNRQLKQDVRPQ